MLLGNYIPRGSMKHPAKLSNKESSSSLRPRLQEHNPPHYIFPGWCMAPDSLLDPLAQWAMVAIYVRIAKAAKYQCRWDWAGKANGNRLSWRLVSPGVLRIYSAHSILRSPGGPTLLIPNGPRCRGIFVRQISLYTSYLIYIRHQSPPNLRPQPS